MIAANQAEAEKSERIRELEEEVASLKEQLTAALAKPTELEGDGELPVKSLEVPVESEPVPAPTPKRAVKKASALTKAKAKAKVIGKGKQEDKFARIPSKRQYSRLSA